MPVRRKRPAFAKRKRNTRKTQRSAYKPRNRNAMRMKRQPFVETKKARDVIFVDEVLNPLQTPDQPTAWYRTWRQKQISPIDQFMFLSRGVGNDKIIGRDIYSKYLKQKIEITLPAGVIPDTTTPNGNQNRPFCRITQPCQIWIVWGWIKRPFSYRVEPGSETALTVDDVYAEIDNITNNGDDLLGNPTTRGQLDSDYLTFKDKRKNLWTMNKRLLKPKSVISSVEPPKGQIWQTTSTPNTQGQVSNRTSDFGDMSDFQGYPNVLQTTISWSTQRKIRYQAADGDTTGGGFARDSWIPFSYICIPKEFQDATNRASPADYFYPTDGSTVTARFKDLVGEMKVSTNMCHWFSDS